jgi:hypothetical protein
VCDGDALKLEEINLKKTLLVSDEVDLPDRP